MDTRPLHQLLEPDDPAPFEVVNGQSTSDILLVCEHAGRTIPASLGTLGLSKEAFEAHVAWDIGAADVARAMAKRLNAPLILQPYSRLVCDCNRPTDALDAMPEINHGYVVPGNQNLSQLERELRNQEIFWPFQKQVDALFDHHPRRLSFAIHSFTPKLNGIQRPWDVGLLFRKDYKTPHRLKSILQTRHSDLNIGLNEPYSVAKTSDWFVPRHAEPRNVGHALIEIRNDLIADPAGVEFWAQLLSQSIAELQETISI